MALSTSTDSCSANGKCTRFGSREGSFGLMFGVWAVLRAPIFVDVDHIVLLCGSSAMCGFIAGACLLDAARLTAVPRQQRWAKAFAAFFSAVAMWSLVVCAIEVFKTYW